MTHDTRVSQQMDMGPDFQRLVLRVAQQDPSVAQQVFKYLDHTCFTQESHSWIYRAMAKYFEDYGVPMGAVPLAEAVAYAPAEKAALYQSEARRLGALGEIPEREWVLDKLSEFIKQAYFARAHAETQKLYNDGNHVGAYDLMASTMDEIHAVDFSGVDRHWFAEGLADRQRMRRYRDLHDEANTFMTGIPPLDDALLGGISIGELFLIMAYAKSGKSVWLTNMGYTAVDLLGAPVLHINLEGTTDMVGDRYDARFSGELYQNVRRGDFSATRFAYLQDRLEHLHSLLVIRTLNDWDVNATNITAELSELKAKGFRPKMIVLDYLDLLRARHNAKSETEHQNAAAKDLKRVANEGYAVWSGTQCQRPKKMGDETPHLLRSSDIADAYAKIRHIDGWGSLNATRREREEGRTRLYWEGYRAVAVGKCFELENDFSRMQIGTGVTEVNLNDNPSGMAGPAPVEGAVTGSYGDLV